MMSPPLVARARVRIPLASLALVASVPLLGLAGCAVGRGAAGAPATAASSNAAKASSNAPAAVEAATPIALGPRSGVFEPVRGPATPALRALQGRIPLVHVTRASGRRVNQPSYELAVFDDGTLMYEGARCVRVGGLVLRRLNADELAEVTTLLGESCVKRPTARADEICPARGGLAISCSGQGTIITATDRCIGATGPGQELATFAEAILAGTGVNEWIGEPTERLACDPLAEDMTTGEIARTLAQPSAAPAPANPYARVELPQ